MDEFEAYSCSDMVSYIVDSGGGGILKILTPGFNP